MALNRVLSYFLLLYFTGLSTFVVASDDQIISVKRDLFINGLDNKCTYADGYECYSSDPNFYSQQAQQSLIPAVYIPAWNSAYKTFLELSELSTEQKKLIHYKIGFAEQDDQIVILFAPLFLPYFDAKEPQGISTGVFGQSLKFWIDKKTLTVSKHIFLK